MTINTGLPYLQSDDLDGAFMHPLRSYQRQSSFATDVGICAHIVDRNQVRLLKRNWKAVVCVD